MFVFFVLLTIVVNEDASHPKIGDDGGMLFLNMSLVNALRWKSRKIHTEYSQMTKFEVSRRLRSLVLRRPSPTLPPLPSFRPALSFFFFAVRTLLNRSSIFDGNCKAGRWNERASCFDSRVLYYKKRQRKQLKGFPLGLTNGSCSFCAGYACSTTSCPKVCLTRWRPPSFATS